MNSWTDWVTCPVSLCIFTCNLRQWTCCMKSFHSLIYLTNMFLLDFWAWIWQGKKLKRWHGVFINIKLLQNTSLQRCIVHNYLTSIKLKKRSISSCRLAWSWWTVVDKDLKDLRQVCWAAEMLPRQKHAALIIMLFCVAKPIKIRGPDALDYLENTGSVTSPVPCCAVAMSYKLHFPHFDSLFSVQCCVAISFSHALFVT